MRTRYLIFLLAFAISAARAPLATAQQRDLASPSSLKAAVQAAWERSPLARTLEARRGEMDASSEAAATWLAGSPTLGLAQRNARAGDQGGARETDVSLSAPVWLPAQKVVRQSFASRNADELEAQIAFARLTVAGEVREQLWAAAMAKGALEAAEDHQHHLELLAREVAIRVRAGDLSRADGLLADQEVLAAKGAVAEASARLAQAESRYSLLTGQAAIPVPAREAMPAMQASAHPRVQAAQASLERARSSLNLVNSIRSDPPSVGVLARREQDRPGAGSVNSIGVSVQIPIGTRSRNRPLEAAANTQLATANAELARAEAQIGSEAALYRGQIRTALQALDTARARSELTREHAALMQKAFRLGERGLAELLRSEALAHEAAVAQRQQAVAVDLAHARLNQALGILP
jgi:cobalt-zinc-cadmium efflux system outer membrane protein